MLAVGRGGWVLSYGNYPPSRLIGYIMEFKHDTGGIMRKLRILEWQKRARRRGRPLAEWKCSRNPSLDESGDIGSII
jgi:hypothetical protein